MPRSRPVASSRPTREQLAAAAGRTIPDVLAPGLDVVFCGINPGLYSGAVGHHFARPGNRFWRALHEAGFTDRVLEPSEDATLLDRGIGLTNLVARATATAAELSDDEIRRGFARLRRRVERLEPRAVAILGVGAYRTATGIRGAALGRQPDDIGGAALWVLPNPSGLNASYQVPELARAYAAVRGSAARG